MNDAFSTPTAICLAAASMMCLGGCESNKRYLEVAFERIDLVGDREGLSDVTDPSLVHPAGIQVSPSGSFWVANNATGVATVYRGDGTPLPEGEPLVVALPMPPGSADGVRSRVTGIVYHGGRGFQVSNGQVQASARYLFATEEGTILGYSAEVDRESAILAVDESSRGAVYRGLAIAARRSEGWLYATNFGLGTVDVFDETFARVTTDLDPAAFEDLELPAGYAPFGIQRIHDRLYVSYAEQDAERRNAVSGPGKGFIDVYALNGRFLRRLASGGELNAPWGMTRSPWSVPYYGSALVVGNAGDGLIHVFEGSGEPLGALYNSASEPVVIDGLWDLVFAVGRDGYPLLYFTSGPNGGANGVFGTLQPVLLEAEGP